MPVAGISVSKQLLAKLPASERGPVKRIVKQLWAKSGGNCFLCGAPMNRAADKIVADHDVPESVAKPGRANRLANLNLVHSGCNAFKRNHPTAPASAFLRFRHFLSTLANGALYSDCLGYFKLSPKKTVLTRNGKEVTFEFPDGSHRAAHVFEEKNDAGFFQSCFVDVPTLAVFHDEDCQPRTIKDRQVWLIYSDLQRNPLHEPPACRTEAETGKVELLMFDGQHKTVANLLMGRNRIPMKVYLELSPEHTRHLVNSIQAKIPKLGLSAFELMAKMGAEYEDRLAQYLESEDEPSENGFLNWVPADQRKRAKQAFENACIANVWEDPQLDLRKAMKKLSTKGRSGLTEAKVKGKLLKPLVSLRPMGKSFDESEQIRDHERSIARTIVNEWIKQMLSPSGQAPANQDRTAIERRTYQPSIEYVARLLRKVAAHILKLDTDDSLGAKKPSESELAEIRAAIKRIADHGVWTHAYTTKKMKAVQDTLSKNQNADEAFRNVGLDLGYAVSGDLRADWAN